MTAKPQAQGFAQAEPARPGQTAPQISHIMPQLIRPGETLTIFGENLSSLLKVEIDQATALILQATDKMILVSVPERVRSGSPVKVTTSLGTAESGQALVIIGELSQLALLDMQPLQGVSGAKVELSGPAFDANPGNNQVRFNGITAQILGLENGKLQVAVPLGASTGLVTVQIGPKFYATRFPFVLLDNPVISEISPLTGGPGTLVTILGRALGEEPAVLFNGIQAELVSKQPDRLVVRVPDKVISGPISVKTARGQAFSPTTFLVGNSPQLTLISPARGTIGQQIKLSGLNLDRLPAGAVIRFNGIVATIVSQSATELVTIVPASASSGPVVLVLDTRAEIFAGQFEVVTAQSAPANSQVSDKALFEIEL